MNKRAALVFIILLAAATAGVTSYNASAQQYPPIVLQAKLTNIYNMLSYPLPAGALSNVQAAEYLPGPGILLMSGQGAYAIASVNITSRSISIISAGSIIGNPLFVFTDNMDSPSWYGFAEDSGEMLLVNASDTSYIKAYYTATRTSPTAAALLAGSNGPVLTALDTEGYAYFYKVPSDYWLEIGPARHDTALASLPYYKLAGMIPVYDLEYNATTSRALLSVEEDAYVGNAAFTLLYYNDTSGSYEPALTGKVTLNGTTNITTLHFYVVQNDGLVVESKTNTTSTTNTYSLNQLPAGNWSLLIVYTLEEVNATTGQLIAYKTWYNVTPLNITPLTTTDLGTIYLNLSNNTLPSILSRENVTDLTGLAQLREYLVPNTTLLNETTIYEPPRTGGALETVFLPVPGYASGQPVTVTYAAKPVAPPASWPENGSTILLVGMGRFLLIYVLDDNMTPQIISNTTLKYVEVADLGSTVTSVSISRDASTIYAGSAAGRIVKLVWDPNYGKYLASNSYQLDTAPVESLTVSPDNQLLLAGSANGVLQLLNTTSWEPLWRGPPGYTGIVSGLKNVVLLGDLPRGVILYSPGANNIEALYNPLQTMVPVTLNLTLTMTTLNGTTVRVDTPKGSTATVTVNGTPVAYSQLTNGQAVFYLPPGVYGFQVNLTGYGNLTAQETVEYPESVISVNVGLRQVLVTAETPASIGDPQKDPGYYLLSGPKPGTAITATPGQGSPTLPYTAEPLPVSAVANGNGTAVLVLWEGVSYTVTGSLEGYYPTPVTVDPYGSGSYKLQMNPILAKTVFNIIDADSQQAGTTYYVGNATVTASYENGRSVTLPVTAANNVYYLPPGAYSVEVTAPHYSPTTGKLTVATPETQYTVYLDPLTYTLHLQVYGSDPTNLSIGNGPLGSARVSISMVWPFNGFIQETLYTSPNGEVLAQLRYGLYKVDVSHPNAMPTEFYILLGSDKLRQVTLTLRKAELFITLFDSEYTWIPVNNATVTLTYLGSTWTANATISVPNSTAKIVLPYGDYIITVSAPYYSPTPTSLAVANSTIVKYFYVDPAYVTLTLQVAYNTTSGLAVGPVQGAKTVLHILKPSVPAGDIEEETGPDGTVTLRVREGIYSITVSDPYTTTTTMTAEIAKSMTLPVKVDPLYGNVTINVTDALTAKPVPGATVEIVRVGPGSTKTLSITTNGTVNLTLPAGKYTLKAFITGRYATSTSNLDLTPGASSLVFFKLEPLTVQVELAVDSTPSQALIGGTTIALPEAPIAGATVKLIPDDPLLRAVDNTTITVTTSQLGTANLENVRSGTYILMVEKDGYTRYTGRITLPAGAPVRIPVMLEPNLYRVQIRLIDNELSNPVLSDYSIIILAYNGVTLKNAIAHIGADHTVTLPAGSYILVFKKQYYNDIRVVLNVSENTVLNLTATPVKYDVGFTLQASSSGIKGPVDNATLVLVSKTWTLKNNTLASPVKAGSAGLMLRPGTYEAYIVNEYYNINVSLGTVKIVGPETLNLTVHPALYTLTINLEDADLRKPVLNTTLLTVVYRGPLGAGVITTTAAKASSTIKVPAGEVTVTAKNPYYVEKTVSVEVRGNGTATIVLDPVRVNVVLNLVDIDGKPVLVTNATVVFKHVATGEILPGRLVQGKIIPYTGLRLGQYIITITVPPSAYINTTTVTVKVSRSGAIPSTIVANPKFYTLNIVLYDPVAGKPARQPFTVTVSRSGSGGTKYGLPMTVNVKNGVLNLTLPFGVYTISVKGGAKSYFLDPKPVVVNLYNDRSIEIQLVPKHYTATIFVVDDRNKPIQGALVEIYRNGKLTASGLTDKDGSFRFTGPYGSYTVEASASGYKHGYEGFVLPGQASVTVILNPGPKVLFKRYLPLLIGVIGLALFAGVFYVARGKILSKLEEEEEYF